MGNFISTLSQLDFSTLCTAVCRILLPILVIWLLSRCVRSLLREKYTPEVWAYLGLPNGKNLPICHWECILGSSRSADLVLPFKGIARSHATLMRNDIGQWRLYGLDMAKAANATTVNGRPVPENGVLLHDCMDFSLAGHKFRFIDLNESERDALERRRSQPGRRVNPGLSLLLLTLIQAILLLEHILHTQPEHIASILLGFGALIAVQWIVYFFLRAIGRTGFEVETLAFFLSTLGLSVAATSVPDDMLKQTILLMAGIVMFLLLGWWLRDLQRAKRFRWPVAVIALLLLGLNLALSTAIFGAKNWLQIGGISIQPSEFVKIAFVYVGTATLDRLFRRRNLLLFIVFSAVCVGALALMGDFGTALVFFACFLVISFLRSGDLATVALSLAGTGLAGFLVITVKPYITKRFATWGHVWEYANDAGYQQTRALCAVASGGFFGAGAGNGWLKNIVAANTDMVFAVICEELGLIVALAAVAALLILAFAAVRNASYGRSSFYVIAGCAAATMLLVQMALNVFGSLDLLPFTGVTFPFLSRGGSSLISCWALLAFIKAGDTRAGASFATKSPDMYTDVPPKSLHDEADEAEFEDFAEFDTFDEDAFADEDDDETRPRYATRGQRRRNTR